MDSTMVMTSTFDQDPYWDPDLYPLPHPTHTGPMEFGGNYQTVPIDRSFPFENTPLQSHIHLDSVSHTPGVPSLDWGGPQQTWQSIESTPPRSESSQRPKMLLEPRPQSHRRIRKPPSGEALERRRQQNRAAQLAFRERSKKQVEEMRQELMQCTEFNQKLYMNVRELLDRTDSLKRELEAILATQPPTTSVDTASNPSSRTNSMELHTSPESTSEYQNQEEESSITVAG